MTRPPHPSREAIAALEHKQWAHWTRYMLDNLTDENIARWRKQIDTPYAELSEAEKDSDRKWADAILEAFPAPVWRDEILQHLDLSQNHEAGLIPMATQILLQKIADATPAPVTQSGEQPGQGVREALEPVLHWYQSDEHHDRPTVDIVRDLVADLQEDRRAVLAIQKTAQEVEKMCEEGQPVSAFNVSQIILRELRVGKFALRALTEESQT